MLDATPMACSLWDEAGNLLECNREALKIFGVTDKEEFARSKANLSPEYQSNGCLSQDKMREHDALAFETGFQQFEWMHRTLSGEELPLEVTLVRVPWKGGFVLAGYYRDLRMAKAQDKRIREADALNREMEVQARTAKAASEAKSRFLASTSHEIRTPLNAIIGISKLIQTDNLNKTQQEYIEDIRKTSQTLLAIINDILDLSKIEAGKMSLFPVHFSLPELFDNLYSMARFAVNSRNLEFRTGYDKTLPELIYADNIRIRQIITNILNNAIKYTRQGFVGFHLTRTVREGRNFLAILIEDSGPGIRQEDIPRIFQSFEQLDGERNRGIIGTGLGLAITKRLVDLMDGAIEVESVYDKGSLFRVLLPLTIGDPAKIERKGQDEPVKAPATFQTLVVDDNALNRKVALAYLARHGIQAETAESGEEALEKAAQRNYDIIFMDQMMPGMDGLETTRRIRSLSETYRETPIIALSANVMEGSREAFFKAGMNDFLPKPIEGRELNRVLSRWLPMQDGAAVRFPLPAKNQSPKPSIDRELGLKNAAGDEELYGQLLEGFKENHAGDEAAIRKALAQGDRHEAWRLAHTLKSTAALIGAEELSHVAAVLAGPPGTDRETGTLEAELAAALDAVLGEL